MNCKTVQNQLSAYLDRELPGHEMLAIRSHISGCKNCAEEEAALRGLKQMLAGTRTPEPPEDLADRLCAAVLAKDGREGRRDDRRTILRTSFLTFAGVAACSMAFTFAVMDRTHPTGPVNSGVATASADKDRDREFAIRRDQVSLANLDGMSGAPVLSSRYDHP